MGKTTIEVSDESADALHDLKRRGESYEDVVQRLLDRDVDISGTTELNEQGRLYLGSEAGGHEIHYTIEILD